MATATLTPHALRQDDRDFIDPQSHKDLLWSARQRFKETLEATQDDREQQARAAKFLAGEQWSSAALAARNTPGQQRPCFTIPLQGVYVKQVVNAWRANPQAMRVRPKGGPASVQTAQVLEGMIRDIEQQSQATIGYTTALTQAVSTGEGYFRLNLDYESHDSFRQVIRIGAIPNRQCVFLDPAAKHPCGLDAEFGFLIETLSWSRFCFTYDVDPGELELWHVQQDVPWLTATTVQVAEYFYRVWEDDTLLRLQDGRVVRKSQAGDTFDGFVVAERETQIPCVYWAKLTGMHVLEQTRWLGQSIPIIRVPGDVSLIEGQVRHTGMVQPSMDAQSSYNYFVSAQTEAIAMAPKAPFRVTPQQVQGFEQYWNAANNANLPYLLWNPQTIGNNTLVPPPERMVAEPAVMAISQARAMAASDIQSTLGMFGPSIGEPSNEKSGVAIQERRGESNQTNSGYAFNMGVALETCGMQVLDLIRALYDTPQMVRTLAMDGEAKPVLVNRPFQGEGGQIQAHYLTQGAYEVFADSGPSYTSQRELAAERLGELGRVLPPEMVSMVADLWVSSLDIPYSSEIAARLKTLVPAQALAVSEQQNPQTQLVQVQNQLKQLSEQMQVLTQQLQESKQTEQVATQQVSLLEKSVADMKVRLDDKSQQNQIDLFKAQSDHELGKEQNALKAEELRLKYLESAQRNAGQNEQAS